MCNPPGRIKRDKRRIRHLHRATGGCGVNALSALHVQSPRPDKTRQASHPALPPGVFFLNPITNPALPFSLFSGDG
ncbi:hypothetical protein AM365_17535 [Escherichia coli]|nr:hypothetical protein B2H83_19360 [Escherichia coli M8]ARA18581.1 hypothetical protein AM365_17535 [Escherichia coli]EFK04665.1 hypothetical protein HMPREF9548_00558 [Escherichia coli MS 182-1]EFK49697.1 hypothetical protein HMPREF9345_03946 [Escherichia coli MS 107-1]EFO59866.1 hypothetical protein HMPREF9348_00809 [Escherichia coli MS 145-7]